MLIAIKEADRVVLGYLCNDYNQYLLPVDLTDPENLPITFSDSGKLIAFHISNVVSDLFIHDRDFINDACVPDNIVRALPTVKRVLADNKFPKPKNPKEFDFNNELLICDDNRIFLLDYEFLFHEFQNHLCRDQNYDAESEILTLLDVTVGEPAEERLRKAAKYLFRTHGLCRYPVIMTDTVTRELKALYEEGGEYEYITKL